MSTALEFVKTVLDKPKLLEWLEEWRSQPEIDLDKINTYLKSKRMINDFIINYYITQDKLKIEKVFKERLIEIGTKTTSNE